MDYEKHMTLSLENNGSINLYTIFPGISIAFNQVYTNTCARGERSIYSDQMLIINFCIHGRCEATLSGNKCAIVKENQICASTIPPTKDFYYPGSFYEGIQLYLDVALLTSPGAENLLSFMGIDLTSVSDRFCHRTRLYIHEMNEPLSSLIQTIWEAKGACEYGSLRYFTVRLLYEFSNMPCEGESDRFLTRAQITIVKEAERIITEDLSRRFTAREMADRFGISESSFKLYVKEVLGDSYLSYFRRKRTEKAALLLTTTNMKVIEIANAVGYENQGKFANVFAKEYGLTPLEYRLSNSKYNRNY